MKQRKLAKQIRKTAGRVGAALAAGVLAFSAAPMTAQAVNREHGYTYRYDFWEDVQDSPDFYTVCNVFTSADLGLDVKMRVPQGLTVWNDLVYVCDTGNNRILEFERKSAQELELKRIIDACSGAPDGLDELSGPTDVAISEEGFFFIADKGNARILKLDPDLNYVMEFGKPTDSAIDEQLVFQPNKIVIDTADRVYCIATGINKGLCKYEADGTFSGFVGATPATYNLWDYLWKKFASQEQRAKMESFVPTEYDNISIDYEGFIYTVCANVREEDLRSGQSDAVRKLNLLGDDILVRNGDYDIYGDLYMGDGGGHSGPSLFTDVTVFDNDIYVCLDRNRGRLFGYNDQGQLLFVFGGNGNMDGYFNNPSAIDHYEHDLYVLDQQNATITSFVTTEFGTKVYLAVEQFNQGNYTASGATWEEVLAMNGNYDLAYIGVGRSLLRQERYKEAMEYFEVKYDEDNYSKAYKQYRKEWVEENILWIVIVILALFLVPMTIGKVKSIRKEIDKAVQSGEI